MWGNLPRTYDECVSGSREFTYVYENEYGKTGCNQWNPDWSCLAAQCIYEWGRQEEYYQDAEPDCEHQPTPWKPEVCFELDEVMGCDWSYGE